jgi:hypothetical protein
MAVQQRPEAHAGCCLGLIRWADEYSIVSFSEFVAQWPLVLALWCYFYTAGISLDSESERIRLPPRSMIAANGCRTGLALAPWIVAHRTSPPVIDVSGDFFRAALVAFAISTVLGPLAVPTNRPRAVDTDVPRQFVAKWAVARADTFLKTVLVAGVASGIGLIPVVPSTDAINEWLEHRFAFVPAEPGHLRLPLPVYCVALGVLSVKGLLHLGAPWSPGMRNVGPVLAILSGALGLCFVFNLALVTRGISGENWRAPGMGVLAALAFSFGQSYWWARWDHTFQKRSRPRSA